MLVALLALAALGCGPAGSAGAQALQPFDRETLAIVSDGNEHRFTVEVARTPAQQSRGLMFRKRMAADAGMLFVHDPPRRAMMWMKNTFIPLDMVFIASDGRIDQIVQRTTPQSLQNIVSDNPVRAVLELNSGTSARLGFKPGDRVIHPAFGAPPE
jgi:hypothetical protein